MDFFEAVKNRKSVRSYSAKPVEQEKLDKLLEAARNAPSAKNRQPYQFIVIMNVQLKEKIAKAALHNEQKIIEAPVLIAAITNPSVAYSRTRPGENYAAMDISIALEHVALAAAALGLGTCWLGSYEEEKIKEILSVPTGQRVAAMMTLGYKKEGYEPEDKQKKTGKELFKTIG